MKELENNGFHTTCCTCINHYSIKFTLDSGNSMEQSGNPRNHYTNLEADLANKKLIIYDNRSRESVPVKSSVDTTVTWPGRSNATYDNVKARGEYGKFAPGTAYSVDDADKLAKVDWVILQVGVMLALMSRQTARRR